MSKLLPFNPIPVKQVRVLNLNPLLLCLCLQKGLLCFCRWATRIGLIYPSLPLILVINSWPYSLISLKISLFSFVLSHIGFPKIPFPSLSDTQMEWWNTLKEMLRVETRKEIMQYSFIHLAIQSSVHSHSLVELI